VDELPDGDGATVAKPAGLGACVLGACVLLLGAKEGGKEEIVAGGKANVASDVGLLEDGLRDG